MKRKAFLLILILLLLIVQAAHAMESANFTLDWFTPLVSSGGGPASSTHYGSNLTIGQTAIYASSSTNYSLGLGYWYGYVQVIGEIFSINLPLIIK